MSKRTLEANYFADDKDIYDLLSAAKQRLTSQKLVALARKRGLIYSSEDEREELLTQIALLPFGWPQLKELVEMTDTADRVDKVSCRSLEGNISVADLRVAVETFSEDRAAYGEVYKLVAKNTGLTVQVSYTEIDLSRTQLMQRTEREFTLEFEKQASDKTLVRYQNQTRAGEVVGQIIELLSTAPDEQIDQTSIELSGIEDPTLRTKFFLDLIHGVDGYALEDVKAVKACPIQKGKVPQSSLDTDDEMSEDSAEADDTDEGEVTTEVAAFVAQIKEIALKGDGLLHAPQYEELSNQGFFVRSIVWTGTDNRADGCRVEFESGFDNPENATGFSYTIRGLYARKTGGEFRKSKSTPSVVERTNLLRLIERSAQKAMMGVVEEAKKPAEDAGAV